MDLIVPGPGNPVYRVEMGIADIDGFVKWCGDRKDLLKITRDDVAGLTGDTIEIGRPTILRDLGQVFGALDRRDFVRDFVLVDFSCGFFPYPGRHFESVRLELKVECGGNRCVAGIHDLFPRQVEAPQGHFALAVDRDFRLVREPADTVESASAVIAARGLTMVPRAYGMAMGEGTALWTFSGEAPDYVCNLRTLYLVLSKEKGKDCPLRFEFGIRARLRTRWGVLPVTVRRELHGTRDHELPWTGDELPRFLEFSRPSGGAGSRTGGAPVRVFVSSTWEDLGPERREVEHIIHRMGNTGFSGMEYFGARDGDARGESLKELRRCDLYIGIFAHRYGSGITEEEYRLARRQNIPCLIYFKNPNEPVPSRFIETDPAKQHRLDTLKEELRRRHLVSFFTTPHHLASCIAADLARMLRDGE